MNAFIAMVDESFSPPPQIWATVLGMIDANIEECRCLQFLWQSFSGQFSDLSWTVLVSVLEILWQNQQLLVRLCKNMNKSKIQDSASYLFSPLWNLLSIPSPLRKDRVGRFLWTFKIVMRSTLNKFSRGLVPPPAIMMAQRNKEGDDLLTIDATIRFGKSRFVVYFYCSCRKQLILVGRFAL